MERKEKGESANARGRIYLSRISALELIGLRLAGFSGARQEPTPRITHFVSRSDFTYWICLCIWSSLEVSTATFPVPVAGVHEASAGYLCSLDHFTFWPQPSSHPLINQLQLNFSRWDFVFGPAAEWELGVMRESVAEKRRKDVRLVPGDKQCFQGGKMRFLYTNLGNSRLERLLRR